MFRSIQSKILMVTIAVFLLLGAVRTAMLFSAYPELSVSLSQICGESDQNLTGLTREGSRLSADSNQNQISFSLPGAIPVYEVTFEADEVSRMNCRSYVNLNGVDQGSVIMKEGKNHIRFSGRDTDSLVSSMVFIPVTLRGVSFELRSFTVNSHLHFFLVTFRTIAFLLSAALLLELVIFTMMQRFAKSHKSRKLAFLLVILGALQTFLVLDFAGQYLTSKWEGYQMTYYFVILLAESGFLLLTQIPDPGKKELPFLRIFLLSAFDFALVEVLYEDMFHLDKGMAIFGNLLIYALLYLVLYLITGRRLGRWTYILPTIWWTFAGLGNHYYFQFRSQAFEFSDLSMASTAAKVMDQYHLDINETVLYVYVAAGLVLLAALTESLAFHSDKRWYRRLPALALVALILIWIPTHLPYVSLWNTNTATKHNGYVLSFFSYMKKSLEKPTPEGYDPENVEAMLALYTEDHGDKTESGTSEEAAAAEEKAAAAQEKDAAENTAREEDSAVNVIVIMDEALADLPRTYGFETDVDCLPYLHSLEGDNVRKGWMLSSVFGGTTANTEYEFLTGNSTAFLNGESVPFTQYINSEQQALPWLMKERGYTATAFHPYYESGYKRYKVYPLLGFDDFLSLEDGLTYSGRMRSYLSDSADFSNVIKLYQNKKEGEPFFLFNVTMQNHGSYNTDRSAVDVTVNPVKVEYQLPQLQEYLSLAHATDAAFRDLTDYFSGVSEKTIILMFGDHQPGMKDSTYKVFEPEMYEEGAEVSEREKKYTVPYVLWANYDLESEELPVTSPGFLRTYLLENAGIPLSAYDRFLAGVRDQFPAINILGYLNAEGEFTEIEEMKSVPALEDYKAASYYNLFDHHHVDTELFR